VAVRLRRALRALLSTAFCGTLLATAPRGAAATPGIVVDARAFRLVESESGPTNYYSVMSEGGSLFLRSSYATPMKTAVMGWQVPEADRSRARRLSWSWRARVLPNGGDECKQGKGDSAAVVYVTWKRTLRYYTLKYVWSAVGTKGSVCDKKRNPFVAQDTVVLESGAPLHTWKKVDLDLRAEFRRHFGDGDENESVPNFVGIGLMSDGDQTKSESSADFGTFTLSR
jgi:hypothetical protein